MITNTEELLASASSATLRTPPSAKQHSKPNPKKPVAAKPKPPPRFAKLDGKPPPLARGRHAVARSDTSDEDDAARETITIPTNQRLGFRPAEFAALTGVSVVTIWRGIKDGKIDVVDLNGVRIIPRKFAIAQG
jgi:hypothetical protein